jgi:hypothetical protein
MSKAIAIIMYDGLLSKLCRPRPNGGIALSSNLSGFYRAISGNGVYGADANDEAKLLGADDSIPIPGMIYGDIDEILIIANSSSTVYLCRLIHGTGTLEDAVIANQCTEFPYLRGNADNVRKVMNIPSMKIPLISGGLCTKVWVQCMNATDNATFDFVIGIHGYGF